jgi:hypothetical protein
VRALPLAEDCFQQPNKINGRIPTAFDWVAFSDYFRPGDDPDANAVNCAATWRTFGQHVPELRNASREIHEFGIAPWPAPGRISRIASAEPGALGAVLTYHLMMRLREVGIHRL